MHATNNDALLTLLREHVNRTVRTASVVSEELDVFRRNKTASL